MVMVGVVMVVVKVMVGEKAPMTLLVSMLMVKIKMCMSLNNCCGVLILKILMLMIMNVLMVR